jgi:putative transposase
MGRAGSALDNAVVESFFSSLELELLRKHRFATRAEARRRVARWIDEWYNPRRRHSACGMRSPISYELPPPRRSKQHDRTLHASRGSRNARLAEGQII